MSDVFLATYVRIDRAMIAEVRSGDELPRLRNFANKLSSARGPEALTECDSLFDKLMAHNRHLVAERSRHKHNYYTARLLQVVPLESWSDADAMYDGLKTLFFDLDFGAKTVFYDALIKK